jgi:hypothetical protein
MIETASIYARHLSPWESLSSELSRGLERLGELDFHWTWVASDGSRILGVLVAAPVHGIALVLKLNMALEAPKTAIIPLLRLFLRDMKERGVKGYLTWFDPSREAEKKFIRIAQRAGETMSWDAKVVAGKIPKSW